MNLSQEEVNSKKVISGLGHPNCLMISHQKEALLIDFHLQVATAVKNDFTLTPVMIRVKTAVNRYY